MDQNLARETIVLSQPLVERQDGRLAVDCALGADRQLHIAIDGPADVLDSVRPEPTAFLPMAMLIAGREGKDVACPGPIDASYLLNLSTSKLDVPLLTLDTNFHELFDEPHLRCHTIRNLCACFALRPWVETFGYSSSSDYQAVSFVDAFTDGISFIDHIVSVSMTPRQLEVLHLGFNATRIEKTKAIVSDPVVQAHLDVCTNGLYQGRKDASSPINCGLCEKCVRTIITLDHLGHLDAFQICFDLAHYRSNRAALLTRLLESSQPLDREAAALLAT